jgi:histidinol-phosphate aminotransferase
VGGNLVKIRDAVLGLKAYQAGKPIDEVKRELGLNDIIKMASNENPLGCSEEVKKVITQLAGGVNLYPDAANYELKKALSENVGVDSKHIFCGTGSDLLIRGICSLVVDPGDETIMPEVSFQRYEDSTQLMGGKTIKIPMKNHSLDINAMVDAINEKTKIIWICSPNNPTGPIVTKDELFSVLDRIPKDVIIVMDEAYREFVTDERYPDLIPLLEKYENMIILRTFSKAYGLAGLRLGYGIAGEEITKYMNAVIGPFDINIIAQAAAVAALRDKEFLNQAVAENTRGKHYFYEEFKRMGLEYIITETNFIMVNLAADDKEVFNQLLRRGIIIRPGHLFGMNGWLRISIGTMEQNKRFIKELEDILK